MRLPILCEICGNGEARADFVKLERGARHELRLFLSVGIIDTYGASENPRLFECAGLDYSLAVFVCNAAVV